MIQDIPSPEMYLSRLPGGRCGGWNLHQDLAVSTSVDVDFRNLRECYTFWAVTVPGESRWNAEWVEGTSFNQGSTSPCGRPLVLIVRTTAPKTPSAMPYLTTRRHKLPNPQSTDFGILLKASPPPLDTLDLPHPSLQVYDEDLTKDLKPMATANFVGILALEP